MRNIDAEQALASFLIIVIITCAVILIGSAIGVVDSHAGQFCLIKTSGVVDFNQCVTLVPR